MFVGAISANNFNFKGRNNAQNLPAQIKMKEALNFDTVSFGSAKPDAVKSALDMAVDIFKNLEALKNKPFDKEKFSKVAQDAAKRINQNIDNIKQIKQSTELVTLDNGTYMKPCSIFGSYIFDHQLGVKDGLLNSIQINPTEKTAKIVSNYFKKGKEIRNEINVPLEV